MPHLKGNSSHRIGSMKEGKRSSNTEQNAGGDLFLGKCQYCELCVHSSLIPSLIYPLLLNAQPLSNHMLGDAGMKTT